MSKTELVLSMGSNYQSTAQIEKELKEFWNNLIEKEGGNRPPSRSQPDKNGNESPKKSNNEVNWLVKSLVIFLVIMLLLGGAVAIRSFVRKKRK